MGYQWHRLHPFAFDCCIVLLCEIDLFPVQQSGLPQTPQSHYNDAIMGTMASQITSLTIINSAVYPGADQRKHQSSASLAFVQGIHRSPVNSPHKGPVTRKYFHLMTSSWAVVASFAKWPQLPYPWETQLAQLALLFTKKNGNITNIDLEYGLKLASLNEQATGLDA